MQVNETWFRSPWSVGSTIGVGGARSAGDPCRHRMRMVSAPLRLLSASGPIESGDGLATRGIGGFRLAAEKANEFNAIEVHVLSFRAHLSRATRSERSPLPSRGEPRAADGEAFSEGPAKDFGALGCARGFRNPKWETEAGCRRKCFGGAYRQALEVCCKDEVRIEIRSRVMGV